MKNFINGLIGILVIIGVCLLCLVAYLLVEDTIKTYSNPQPAILMCGKTATEVNAKKVKQGDTFFTIVDSEGEVYIGVNKCSMRIKR